MGDILMWVILPLCAVAEIILTVRSIRLQSHFNKLQKRFDELGAEKAELKKRAEEAPANPDDRRFVINPPAGRLTPPGSRFEMDSIANHSKRGRA